MATPVYSLLRHTGAWVLVAACVVAAYGAEVYVSPSGNDAAAGTQSAPLATLTAARDKADQLKAGNTPVTVYLRGGTYYVIAPVVFGPANSGSAAAPIMYTAYGSEKPVISGGIKVTSAWTVSSGQIMVTTIAQNLKVDQLFLNGKRQILARYPNFNATQRLDGSAADCIGAARVNSWGNPAEGPGYIRGLHVSEWGGNSYKITGKSGSTVTQQWVGDNNRGSGMHATYRMVENIFEELDAPGEWYYRKSTGQLFFYPPAGTSLGTSVIELASQDELMRLVGSSAATGASVKYIQLKGITFTHTYRTLFSKTYETILKSDWGLARAGAVFMQNAENIRMEKCFFDQIGGNGIFMSGYNRNNVVFNNTFVDAGASCVLLVGLTSSVRCPNSWSSTPNCIDRTKGPLTNEYPAFVTVDNNTMDHFGMFEKQTAGVNMSMTEFDTVRHNTVHDCPRAGINFTDGCWGGHVIEYNWVYNAVLETGDHGPFNAWGRDRNNLWPTDSTATTLDARNTTVIRNNRFEVRQGCFGIDLDDQASNYLQYNNLLIGGGLKLQWHRYNTYLNNVLVNGADVQIHGVWRFSQNYVARNIFTAQMVYYVGFFNGAANALGELDSVKFNTKLLDSNCVPANADVNTEKPQAVGWTDWTNKGLDVHSVKGDPLFTDINKTWPNYLPKGDYTVRAGSPALTIGFRNFPMDSFGVMPVRDPNAAIPRHATASRRENGTFKVSYDVGRVSISRPGCFHGEVINSQGRVLATFDARDRIRFELSGKSIGSGIYFVEIRAENAAEIRRFIVH